LRPTQQKIPKRIHQVYFSDRALPDEIEMNIRALLEKNPDWDYKLYNEGEMQDFVNKNFCREIVRTYEKLDQSYGAARVDLFRYLLLYRLGGVYLDIKSSAGLPLSEVIRSGDTFLISQWRNNSDEQHAGWGLHDDINWVPGGEFQQWYIAAAPEHPFLAAVIENVLRNIKLYNQGLHGSGQYGVLRLTGPIAYTASIAPILHLFHHRRVDSEKDLGLVYSIYGDERHVKLFKEHYSGLRIPIVKQDFNENILSFLYRSSRHLKTIMTK
jgi:mannosyltransferase OCH1-like enzyme